MMIFYCPETCLLDLRLGLPDCICLLRPDKWAWVCDAGELYGIPHMGAPASGSKNFPREQLLALLACCVCTYQSLPWPRTLGSVGCPCWGRVSFPYPVLCDAHTKW